MMEINTSRKVGFQEGIEKEKKDIAKKMIEQDIDINTISSVTGLFEE